MKLLPFIIIGALVLPSCSYIKKMSKPGEYSPEYLRKASPLDPPGMAAAREAARNKLVKEGQYKPGDKLEVQQGKAYLFTRNPDHYKDPSGKMVDIKEATILSCEGMYYFVQTDDGQKGFLRDSDFVNPVKLVSNAAVSAGGPVLDGTMLPGGNGLLPEGTMPMDDSVPAPQTVQLSDNQSMTTNEDGRTVVVVNKKTDRSSEFEARKKALLEAQESGSDPKADDADAKPADIPAPAYEALPEPSHSAQ